MGGGAGMRSAAKLAGMGMGGATSRLGGILPSSVEHPVVQRAAQSLRSAVVNSPSVPLSGTSEVAPMQTSTWESEDWEFAEFDNVEPRPRLVFGPAPSLEEAKSATNDLKLALDKGYTFPTNPADLIPFGRPGCSSLSGSGSTEAKDCVTYDPVLPPLATSVAERAFVLLHESPAAQSIVASIAADPNVWRAVVQNPALQDYLDSYHKSLSPTSEESVGDTTCLKSNASEKLADFTDDESTSGKPENHGNGFVDVLEFLKGAFVDMANNAFTHIKSMFGFSAAEHSSTSSDPGASFITASFMGLAVMVIMVVIFKRV